MIDLKYVETPVEQCFIGPRPILGPSYSCFHGAQSLYDLDIKCIDYSPQGLLKELWRICEVTKSYCGRFISALHYRLNFFSTWDRAG